MVFFNEEHLDEVLLIQSGPDFGQNVDVSSVLGRAGEHFALGARHVFNVQLEQLYTMLVLAVANLKDAEVFLPLEFCLRRLNVRGEERMPICRVVEQQNRRVAEFVLLLVYAAQNVDGRVELGLLEGRRVMDGSEGVEHARNQPFGFFGLDAAEREA